MLLIFTIPVLSQTVAVGPWKHEVTTITPADSGYTLNYVLMRHIVDVRQRPRLLVPSFVGTDLVITSSNLYRLYRNLIEDQSKQASQIY